MKRFLLKIIRFFQGRSILKYVSCGVIICGLVLLNFFMFPAEIRDNFIGMVIGFFFTTLALYVSKIVIASIEDISKVSGDTKHLLKVYTGDKNYEKVLRFKNGSENSFIYHECLINDGKTEAEYKVVDDKDKRYELPDFIGENFVELFEAHSNSTVKNELTVRLDDYKDGVFYLSRSNFFNHLVTNRAIDYALEYKLTLRDVFEYGPYIKPLAECELSNHIGINGLVFLSDGYLLVPQRKKDSTISKGCITASIATRLILPTNADDKAENEKDEYYNPTITSDYLFKGNVINSLEERLHFDLEKLGLKKDGIRVPDSSAAADIRFLGFGQNIYEGGKPQFYFAVTLNNVNINNYRSMLKSGDRSSGVIDKDDKIFVSKLDTFGFGKRKDYMNFVTFDDDGTENREITKKYEKSFAVCLWHYFNSPQFDSRD